jgi:antitoxin HicB
VRTRYSYPATLERDEDGRYLVRFPDLPEALTDGADEIEALAEAADCLSEALASRIVDDEEIPPPSLVERGQYLVSPDPTITLKAGLYTELRRRGMTIADLADRLGMADWHQAARLIDPKRPTKLKRLATALAALGGAITIEIAISEGSGFPTLQAPKPEIADYGAVRLGSGFITAGFPPLQAPKPEIAVPRCGTARGLHDGRFFHCVARAA